MKKWNLIQICVLTIALLCSGCGVQKQSVEETELHLTVYLWDNNLIKDITSYIKEQIPDADIEFIVGNNNVDLYNYLEEHNALPDVITTRRFSEKDADLLQPYLLDLSAYNIVSDYYPYALQYYTDSDGTVRWLPVCGIPETIIANKTLFDQYGINIPKNYQEFSECCKKLQEAGIKPYTSELGMDWAAHSLIQGAAIDQFSSIDGIEWRSNIETTFSESAFQDDFWKQIFHEVNTFIIDTGLESKNAECTIDEAREKFMSGEAAMFRGTPSVMDSLESKMDAELIRIPYFSQTSDESWVYTYPSFNVSLNANLADDEEKRNLAMKVLDCFTSKEGQDLIADGDGWISYNAHVDSDFTGMKGIEDEIEKNAFYIRYASNGSFSGSLQAVKGLLTGEMREEQAYEAFKKEVCSKQKTEPGNVTFEKQYAIELNEKDGRDAASSILTTVRKNQNADVALSSYYYYTSSIFKGSCTENEVNMMIAHNDGTFLTIVDLDGTQIKELVRKYLTDGIDNFKVMDKYELPIASGMKLVVKQEKDAFQLENIEVSGHPIEDTKMYHVLLTNEMMRVLQSMNPDEEWKSGDLGLADAWTNVICNGQQPSGAEDYIEVK